MKSRFTDRHRRGCFPSEEKELSTRISGTVILATEPPDCKPSLGQTAGLGSSKEKREQKPRVLLEYSYFERGGWERTKIPEERRLTQKGR